MKTKTRKNLLKLVGVCCVGAVALSLSFATGNITASAAEPDKATGFYMEDGAAVAKTADLDAAISWKGAVLYSDEACTKAVTDLSWVDGSEAKVYVK